MDAIQMIPAAAPVILGISSVLLLAVSIYLARPWLAGLIGNARIERSLNQLKNTGATVLNNVLLADKKGDATHIDHLIITNAQIIAISTLGYSGEILGSVRGASWIQETRQGSYRFPNPVKHHETIRNILHGILGERVKVRTISAFTSGRLNGNATDDVVSAQECVRVINAAVEGVTTGSRQQWAGNVIRNVQLEDRRKRERELAFISRQGNEKHLKAAHHLMAGSAALMLLAIVTAGLRLAANHGAI
ncbi:MAG: nuclease-related domain-containing protein [Mariprofundaceae bacterium]|nr:nuclease-related domain-containing protein [Mariprofundaceae bacterium]